MFKPQTLRETIGLARMRDEKLTCKKRLSNLDSQSLTQVSHSIIATSSTTTPPKQSQTLPVKKISWDEMQKRCAKGLCFNCNDKFVLGHECNAVQAFLIEKDEPTLTEFEDKRKEEIEDNGYKLSTSISHIPP
jgi:hypothetical protein